MKMEVGKPHTPIDLTRKSQSSCTSNFIYKDQDIQPNTKTDIDLATCSPQESNQVDQDTETSLGGPIQYHCDFCQKDITDVFRIRCAECSDFDLCTHCFTSGVETGPHRNTHSYIPIGSNDFSLFTVDWNADEEVMLLEGVSKYGFGNWAEVAELVSCYNSIPKTKEQCEAHYYDVHIAPFCAETQNNSLEIWFGPSKTPDMSNADHRNILQDQMIGRYHRPMPKPLTGSLTSASCKVVGFMPLRGDFDVEYDNDAELVLSDIEFRGDETPQERELKLKVIDIYNAKLDERLLRKRVLIERGLADWRKIQQSGKRKPKEEVELRNLFGYLVRFDIPIDPDELVELILSEKMLRRRLKVLQEWQSLGLQTYEDVENYENSKAAMLDNPCSVQELKLNTTPNIYSTNETLNASIDSLQKSKIQSSTEQQSTSAQTKVVDPNKKNGMTLEAPASYYPGSELLTSKELNFCDQLQLPPIYFLLTKYSLINAMADQEGCLTLGRLNSLHLDGAKVGSVYDFILHSEIKTTLSEDVLKKCEGIDSTIPRSALDTSSEDTGSQLPIQRQRVRRRPLYLEELDDSFKVSCPEESKDSLVTKNRKLATQALLKNQQKIHMLLSINRLAEQAYYQKKNMIDDHHELTGKLNHEQFHRRSASSPSSSSSHHSRAPSLSTDVLTSTEHLPSFTLIISNLTRSVNKNHIKEIVECFAHVVQIKQLDHRNHSFCRFSISFNTFEDAETALKHLHGGQIDGRVIHVTWADKEKADKHLSKQQQNSRSPRETDHKRRGVSESPATGSSYIRRGRRHDSPVSKQRYSHANDKKSTSRSSQEYKSQSPRHSRADSGSSCAYSPHSRNADHNSVGLQKGRCVGSKNRGSKYYLSNSPIRSTSSRSHCSGSSWSSASYSASKKKSARSRINRNHQRSNSSTGSLEDSRHHR